MGYISAFKAFGTEDSKQKNLYGLIALFIAACNPAHQGMNFKGNEIKLMKKCFVLMLLVLFSHIYALPAMAEDIFQKYVKVIWIDQPRQMGVAYEDGIELFDFPVMTGDDEYTTAPGVYVVKLKVKDYYSHKYHSPMPYSIFFDLKGMKAIHEGEVPPPNVKKGLATHGCIHVELPDIERLYDWTEEEETVVVIDGWRSAN